MVSLDVPSLSCGDGEQMEGEEAETGAESGVCKGET